MKKRKIQMNHGVTLIALVITIIVLLILAGVTIATLTGQNGILTRATDASKESEIASVKEQAQLDIADYVAQELENGKDGTVDSPEEVKNILDTANPEQENRYYKDVVTEGVQTPSGYIVPIEELYISNVKGETITEINAADYGKKVNYISKGDSSLVWRIFYHDDNYIYLISSKADGSNTVESCQLDSYPGSSKTYTGSADITDSFLQSLNSRWFEALGGTPSTNDNAKAVAYFMDQEVWDEYTDSEGNASYAIGGPTLELLMNSYNQSEETTNEIEITACTTMGYRQNTPTAEKWLSPEYNNGIYNNGISSYLWIASPHDYFSNGMIFMSGENGYLTSSAMNYALGLRPMVIIPKSEFKYQIISETNE